MRQRPNIHLTREERDTIARWWRFMLPAVFIAVLTLLGADRAYQKLWPTTPSTQVAGEGSQIHQRIGFSETWSAR
jgi:hypothetical protein